MDGENIKDLKDGVYEKVISKTFAKLLKEAEEKKEIWTTKKDVDAVEAVDYLTDYLSRLVKISLKNIAEQNSHDEENGLTNEINFTNSMVEELVKRSKELGDGHGVIEDKDWILTSLESTKNKTSQKKWVLPETSISRSFLFTNSPKDAHFGNELKREIQSADRIDLLVSFIKYSGLLEIIEDLRNFTNRGGKLRVITTTYMGATDPKAIEELEKLPNTEIKISYNVKSTRLHAKSYIFYRKSGFSTAYVGSSNLSHFAISEGMEWNVKVTEHEMPTIMSKIYAEFDSYWNREDFESYCTSDWDKLCKAVYGEKNKDTTSNVRYSFDLQPYPFQQKILDTLRMEREIRGRYQNLIVAATGTGKTAIAAFDYRNFVKTHKGARLLFVAHRKEILAQSLDCFRQVMKNPNFGELAVGQVKPSSPEHLFMSIQTLNSSGFLQKMDPDYYDMIIIDEFHHAAAKSYQELLKHFKPKILLGLTATPERTDGGDILKYFDGHMAAEIRLPDAIEKGLLCSFHYFGVDDPIDLQSVKWANGQYDTGELTRIYTADKAIAKQRAEVIRNALVRYTADLNDVKALGFCVSKAHAHYMAEYFNNNGISSIALDADSQKTVRDSAKQKLERGEIKVIFTVDLFNEGVDIPAVNTVLFLRPTNSLTVFLQQLGRGLRLHEGKDCLTVLDFVAQANDKYNFAARFTGILRTKNVSIKKEIEDGFPHVPIGCYIHLEKEAQQHILDNIKASIGKAGYYKDAVKYVKGILGHLPSLSEFFEATGIEPAVFYNGKRTYARLLANAGLIPDFTETDDEESLEKALPRLLSMDSPKWIDFIQSCYETGRKPVTEREKKYLRMWSITLFPDGLKNAVEAPWESVSRFEHQSELRKELLDMLAYRKEAIDVIPESAELPYDCAMEVYCNYTRDQLFAALGFAKPSIIREGVKFLHSGNSDIVTEPTDVFLVTLNKSTKEFSNTTRYDDRSLDKYHFQWQSQSTTTPESKTGRRYIEQKTKGNYVLLFVRSSIQNAWGNSMAYTFLGKAEIVNWYGSQPMTIIYRLEKPIPAKYISVTDVRGAV